ncbi:SEC-C domain-containing protein (plasmid) [Sutcliffiella horikoshii]|uniref:SEC-C domain-containing protein n=1 Tax=Sutcliffiella horikoshii TaxID=79883 RepID=UPI001CBD4863|nr:SEC-C domain-containing protein [Sutcliffiella horikoshii]UAL49786.1 SEC-C domain-containing protein [Sutcliffiella horikoshii]
MNENNKKVLAWTEFKYSLQAYLNYSLRKIKRNSSYQPHPLVKALTNAMHAGLDLGKGKPGNYSGLSGDADKHEDKKPRELYAVIINIDKKGLITILEINDLIIGKSIPIEVIIYLLILSMEFEKSPSENINMREGIQIVNETIPEINMVLFNNSEWKEARDHLKKLIESGNFSIPQGELGDKFVSDIMKVKMDTHWSDFPPNIRSIIAMTWLQTKEFEEGKQNVYVSSLEEYSPKSLFIKNVKEFLFGKPSEYFAKYLPFSNINLNKDDFIIEKNIKRNDKCPCGSGKKYKSCCMSTA